MFLHRLALALGRTVRELEDGMTARELRDWVVYYDLEPFGAARDNLHAGIIASVIANQYQRKGAQPITPADFMLVSREERRQRSLARGVAQLTALARRGKKR